MFTFVVAVGVVAASIAAVLYVVLNGPEQPVTMRTPRTRVRHRSGRESQHRGSASSSASPRLPVGIPAASPAPLPDSDVTRLRVEPARTTTLWVRIRSVVALVVLVAILGTLIALATIGVVLGAALLIRSATAG